jgi:hypothetical protein
MANTGHYPHHCPRHSTDPERVLRYVLRTLRRRGFDTADDEIASAANFALCTALKTWRGVGYFRSFAVTCAIRECLLTVGRAMEYAELSRDMSIRHPRYIPFADGTRFGAIPWGHLETAAMEFCLTHRCDDHYLCDGIPEYCVAVSPDTFDSLLGAIS